MPDPLAFFQTLYLGDRCFLGWSFDAREDVLRLYVDEISRVRGTTWDYHNEENIQGGCITFSGVVSMQCNPSGPLPNDFIEIVSVESYGSPDSGLFVCTLALGSVGEDAATTTVHVEMVAKDAYLESPDRTGEHIR